jgi:uncharacterized YccA/Bax inhibitor family protein
MYNTVEDIASLLCRTASEEYHVRTTNPLLTRLSADAARERAATAQPYPAEPYQNPTTQDVLGTAPARVRPMTVDDVVVRTVGLLALVVIAAGATWTVAQRARPRSVGSRDRVTR